MTARTDLAGFFRPANIALVGASDRSAWSRSVFARFGEYGHPGRLFAINRGGHAAHGLPGFTSATGIPERVDLAFLIVPAAATPDALRDVAAAGIRHAVILSSGFAETGAEGAVLQEELRRIAGEAGMLLLGPNSLGFANFAAGAYCTAIRSRLPPRPGSLAIVSQSGAVASEMAKWAHAQGIGLSFLCATGNEAGLGAAEIVEHLVDDPATRSIALYVEGIGAPARLMAAAARARAAAKPVVMLKIGRSAVSRAVAEAHTGALLGDDRAFEAMCRRHAVVRAGSIEELVVTADFLGRVGPIGPPRIGMVSISGGACGMYADLAAAHGLATPAFAEPTRDALRAVLPAYAATLNPLDITGAAVQDESLWTSAIPPLARDPGIGLVVAGLPVPNTPDEARILETSFEAIARGCREAGRTPVILSLSMQDATETQLALRARIGLPIVLPDLEQGVRALAHLQRWSEALARPAPAPPAAAPGAPAPIPVGERAALAHLARSGVPVVPAALARDAAEAVAIAAGLGGPVALKVASPDIAHKTEAGGVRLGLAGAAAIAAAHAEILDAARARAPGARIEGVLVSPMREAGVELIVGVARDPSWGPVIVVGLGGVFAELLDDSQARLLPIAAGEALDMLRSLRGAAALGGFRGAPAADLDRLAAVVAAIGDAALALGPGLAALEVNPLWVRGDRIECLDALAVPA